MTLTLDSLLGIAGLIIGLVGVIIAIKSDQKMKTARKAEKVIEKKLLHHMATQAFDSLAVGAIGIMAKIREHDWTTVAQLANNLGRELGKIRGGWSHLLQPLEKDKLDGAAINIQQFIDSIPMGGQGDVLSEDQIQAMLVRCRSLVDASSEVAGRLSVESMREPEEEK